MPAWHHVVHLLRQLYFGRPCSHLGRVRREGRPSFYLLEKSWTRCPLADTGAAKKATLEGHADERGTREYNLALGERRANSAKNYLVGLGIDVVRRMWKQGLHIHPHQHGSERHLHLHEHAPVKAAAAPYAHVPHSHTHKRMLPLRALCVGLVHGMAGSAALVLLTLGTIESVWLGIAYIARFGIGSIGGMMVLSFAIGLPLRLTAHKLGSLYTGLTAVIGLLTIFLGASILWDIGVTQGLLF
jgi:hypothetical protein